MRPWVRPARAAAREGAMALLALYRLLHLLALALPAATSPPPPAAKTAGADNPLAGLPALPTMHHSSYTLNAIATACAGLAPKV